MQTLALGREKEVMQELDLCKRAVSSTILTTQMESRGLLQELQNTSSLLLRECIHFVEGFYKSGNVLCYLWLLAFLQDKPCTGVYSIHHTLDCFFLSRVLHGLRK